MLTIDVTDLLRRQGPLLVEAIDGRLALGPAGNDGYLCGVADAIAHMIDGGACYGDLRAAIIATLRACERTPAADSLLAVELGLRRQLTPALRAVLFGKAKPC